MDETRKAASVAQLQELSKTFNAKLEQQSGAAAGVELAALRSLVESMAAKLISLETSVQQWMQRCEQMDAKMSEPPTPQDLSPVVKLIEQQGAATKEMLTAVISLLARPMNRTGEATLPNGERITLQVSESRQ